MPEIALILLLETSSHNNLNILGKLICNCSYCEVKIILTIREFINTAILLKKFGTLIIDVVYSKMHVNRRFLQSLDNVGILRLQNVKSL